MEKNQKNRPSCKFVFLGVFFVGLLLLGITTNYYLQKEPGEEHEARNRRVAEEIRRFKE